MRLVPDPAARVDLDSIFAEIDAAMERFAAANKENVPASLAASAADLEAERAPIETPVRADTTTEHQTKLLPVRGEQDATTVIGPQGRSLAGNIPRPAALPQPADEPKASPPAISADREVERSRIAPPATTDAIHLPEPQASPRSERETAIWPPTSDSGAVHQSRKMRPAAVPPPDNANEAFTNGCWSRLLWAIGVSDASAQDPGALTYEPYFGLQEKPFSLSPDPRFFFGKSSHGAAFNTLVSGIRRREGILVLTGEVGTGKTMLCRAVLQALDRKTFAAFVPDPCLSPEDLLKKLLVDFGVVTVDELRSGRMRTASRTDLSYPLYEFLASLQPLHAFAVVIIDEAQNLPPQTLEEIRILSDLDNRQKLLEVLLVGQPELQSRLATSTMRHLSQRVSIRCELAPLANDEVRPYISHRLTTAGGDGRVQFTAATIDQIAAASGGIPRVINLVCDRALVAAARARTTTVDVNHIGWAIDDLKLPAQTWRAPSREHLGPHVESSDKDFAKASTAREHQHQLPPQGEGLVPTADSVDNGPGDLPLDTARSPAAFSSTVLDIEIAQARASDVREVAAAQLVFEEGVKAARRRRPTQWALVGAGLVLLTGLSGYWYSRAPASRQPSGVLAQPAQPQLPVQAPPERPVNPLPTAKSQVAGSPSPTPVQTETKVAAPGAPANAVSPAREGERAASEKSRNGQTGAKFVLQMATFQTPARAEQALQEFSDVGYVAYSREVSLKDGAPAFTVFLGPYADLALAEQDLARARQIPGYVSARVVPVGASVRLPRRPQP